jgi:predicted RNA binding protein YcfA (HicA-like mRNA interferase family)
MRRLNNNLKFRDVDKILKRNGFIYDKTRGSHHQYVKNGQRIVVNRDINPCVWLRLVKENHLEV